MSANPPYLRRAIVFGQRSASARPPAHFALHFKNDRDCYRRREGDLCEPWRRRQEVHGRHPRAVRDVIDAEASLLSVRVAASAAATSSSYTMIIVGGIAMLLVAIASLLPLNAAVTRGIMAMTAAIGRLAQNDMTIDIPFSDRRDEVGAMAKAVQVFKDNAIRVSKLEQKEVGRHP